MSNPEQSINIALPVFIPSPRPHHLLLLSPSFFLHSLLNLTSASTCPFSSFSISSCALDLAFDQFLHSMESSSHITGDDAGEGCNSCESGWTMYLASPMHGEEDAGGSGKGSGSEGSSVDDGYGYIISDRIRNGKKAYEDYYADADDDDSLASDASTGPAKVIKGPSLLSEDGKKEEEEEDGGGHGKNGKEEDEEEDDVMRSKFPTTSRKKAGKVEKGDSSRRGNSKRGSSSRRSFFLW